MLRFSVLILLLCLVSVVSLLAAPPVAPEPGPDFTPNQTPARPTPFPVTLVDQGKSDPRLQGITAPEGFKVEIVAEAPVVVNPVGMTFGPDGSLYVLEWRPDAGNNFPVFYETIRYRDGSTREIATMKKQTYDVVKKLSFNAKTKTYDKAEVILTEELPSSILFHDGWLYVSGRGTIRRYKQSKPGGRWDTRETIAQGFCGYHHHQVSGMTLGHDGWLYITTGDDDNVVEGSDGSRASVMRTGAIYRCQPDGSKMEVISLGYRNPYRDIAPDDCFNWFHTDNDQEDGSKFQGCRIVHIAEGVDYGWRLKDGVRCCRTDFVRGAVAGELPGKLPPMIKTGRGSPAGLLIYHDTQLPAHYQGLLYYPDVFRKLIRAYRVAPAGSSFAITHELEFMSGTDPLFRPCQMVTGPDGAMYVCDWRTDSGGAGKLFGDGVNGRIYRLTWAGTQQHPAIPTRDASTWKNLASAEMDEVAKAYRSADATTRFRAQREMLQRAKGNPDLVRAYFRKDADAVARASTPTRILCLGGLMQLPNEDVIKFLTELVKEDLDAEVRRTAVEGLGWLARKNQSDVVDTLTRALSDDSLAVRRVAAIALGRIGSDGTADVLVNAWKGDPGKDLFLMDAYLRGIENLGKPGMHALLALASSGQKADLDRVVGAFLAFRSPQAVQALPELIANVHLTDDQRGELIRSYVNYLFDKPLSLEPLAVYLRDHPNLPASIKLAGLDTFAFRGDWQSPAAIEFVIGLITAREDAVRLAAIQAVATARLPAAAKPMMAILADSQRPLPERIAILKAATTLADKNFIKPVSVILQNSAAPAELKVEALRTLVSLEPAAARPIAEALLDSPDTTLLTEAILTLGATKEGAQLVGERYLAKKLPRDLFPRVSEALRKFPTDDAISKLNEQVMRGGLLLSLEPAQIDKIRQQVLKQGDAKKGKALYLNSALVACAACHGMEGVGGNIGPDLTRVWDTQTIEKLLESMVTPSKEIKEGYQTYRAATLAGQIFTGLKVFESPREVVLREASGREVRILKADLEEFTATPLSLMPDNAVSQLSYEQFIDLLAFLKSRKEQESLRGAVLEYQVLASGKANLDLPDPLPAEGWKTQAVDPTGLLLLKPQLPAEPAGVLLRTFVYSAKPQTVKATLLADDAVRVQVQGREVFKRTTPKIQPFQTEESWEFPLEQGWNSIVLKLSTTGATHRLGLQLHGESLRIASTPEKPISPPK